MKLKLVELTYEYKSQLCDMLEEWIKYNQKHSDADHSPFAIFKNDYHGMGYGTEVLYLILFLKILFERMI